MAVIPRSYSESKLLKFPEVQKKPVLKNRPRKKRLIDLVNFDAFELNKTVISANEFARSKKVSSVQVENYERERPIYIGQMLYIRPSYIVSLPEFSFLNKFTSEAFKKNEINLLQNQHGGLISGKADKKIRNAINWLICSAEPKKVFNRKFNSWFDFKVNFITVTLPDTAVKISDYDFKTKLLNPFLTYLRKFMGLKNYVWKLEFQKNGKLHLHLTSDTFLNHIKLRSSWNKILLSNGYLIDFAKKFGHLNPNSTDIHSVKKIKNLGAYMAKYMCKPDVRLKSVKGRIWGCNYELSRANKTSLFIDRNLAQVELKPLMNKKIDWRKMQMVNKKTGLLTDRGEIFYLTYSNWQNDITGSIKDCFSETILSLKNILHDGSLFSDLSVN